MHEVFIRRNVFQKKSDQEKMLFHHACNCVLVHQHCHSLADTKENKIKCAVYLISYEGYQPIKAWLQSLPLVSISQELALLEEAYELYTSLSAL